MSAAAPTDATKELANGAFVRTASTFRSQIRADGSSEFPPEAGRYIVYVSYACPWASRVLMYLKLKGLDHAIEVVVVAPKWAHTKPGVDDHRGWMIDPTVDSCSVDPVFGANSLREVYERASGGQAVTKFTVPLLLDKRTKTIVNNESSDIIRMLNTEFNSNGVARHPEVDLYPAELRSNIDEINADIYDNINNGVYKSGFAVKQEPYLQAVTALFACLDKYEALLSKQRYLCSNTQLTEADVRFFVTLIRFDEVYVVHFKCNKRPISQYPALHAYTLDIYQHGDVASTVNMAHIKQHYFGSHPHINPHGIIPIGPGEDLWAPHGRAALFAPHA